MPKHGQSYLNKAIKLRVINKGMRTEDNTGCVNEVEYMRT